MRYLPIALLALTACGSAPDNAESTQAPIETCGADWKRYDVPIGACLAAFSTGYDWQDYVGLQPSDALEAFKVRNIHVNETPDYPDCRDVAQFGLFVRPIASALAVSLKDGFGTVTEFPAGSPDCELMRPEFDSY